MGIFTRSRRAARAISPSACPDLYFDADVVFPDIRIPAARQPLNGHRIRRRIHSGMVIGPPRYFYSDGFFRIGDSRCLCVFVCPQALSSRYVGYRRRLYRRGRAFFGRRDRKDRQPDGKSPQRHNNHRFTGPTGAFGCPACGTGPPGKHEQFTHKASRECG